MRALTEPQTLLGIRLSARGAGERAAQRGLLLRHGVEPLERERDSVESWLTGRVIHRRGGGVPAEHATQSGVLLLLLVPPAQLHSHGVLAHHADSAGKAERGVFHRDGAGGGGGHDRTSTERDEPKSRSVLLLVSAVAAESAAGRLLAGAFHPLSGVAV